MPIDQVINLLRDSTFPAERERAAASLATFDWRTNPHVVSALIHGATQDPAASVRAACVHQLGQIGAATDLVRNTLQLLRADSDPRVREQVEWASARLSMPQSGAN
jgi:hypothetical protein